MNEEQLKCLIWKSDSLELLKEYPDEEMKFCGSSYQELVNASKKICLRQEAVETIDTINEALNTIAHTKQEADHR